MRHRAAVETPRATFVRGAEPGGRWSPTAAEWPVRPAGGRWIPWSAAQVRPEERPVVVAPGPAGGRPPAPVRCGRGRSAGRVSRGGGGAGERIGQVPWLVGKLRARSADAFLVLPLGRPVGGWYRPGTESALTTRRGPPRAYLHPHPAPPGALGPHPPHPSLLRPAEPTAALPARTASTSGPHGSRRDLAQRCTSRRRRPCLPSPRPRPGSACRPPGHARRPPGDP